MCKRLINNRIHYRVDGMVQVDVMKIKFEMTRGYQEKSIKFNIMKKEELQNKGTEH